MPICNAGSVRFPFFLHFATFIIASLLRMAISIRIRWYLIVFVIYISLVISDVEHLVEMLSTPVGHLYIFFVKMSIQVLCPFLIGFLPLNCMSSLHILDVNPLSDIGMCVLGCSGTSNSLQTPRTAVCQAPLYMTFSRQEYWNYLQLNRLLFSTLGDLSNPGIKAWVSCLLHWQVNFLPLCRLGSPIRCTVYKCFFPIL